MTRRKFKDFYIWRLRSLFFILRKKYGKNQKQFFFSVIFFYYKKRNLCHLITLVQTLSLIMLFLLMSVFTLFAVSSSQCTSSISLNNSDYQNLKCSDYDLLWGIMDDSLFVSSQDHQRTVDFTYSATHPFILDFTLKNPTEKNTYDFFMRFFDLRFLNTFQKFSNLTEAIFMLGMHPNQTNGMRIHMVGVEISADDYYDVCNLLGRNFEAPGSTFEEGDLSVYLDCPTRFSWPSCGEIESNETEFKEMENLFMPARLVHVQFEYYQENCMWHTYRIKNNLYPQPADFLKWISSRKLIRDVTHVPRVTHIHLPARIEYGFSRKRWMDFKSYLNDAFYSILKENVLVEGKNFIYDFIKENSFNIFLHGYQHTVLNNWQGYFQSQQLTEFHDFLWVDIKLRKFCPHLKHEKSPLETVLKAHERPVYYALYNMFFDKESVVQDLHKRFPFLSKDLPAVPPKEAEHLTFDTILYCAYHTGNDTFIDHLRTGYDWIIRTITSMDQLAENIIWVQKKTFPIVVGVDRKVSNFSSIPGPQKVFWWDLFTQNWKEMDEPILNIMDIVRWSMEILNTDSELPTKLTKEFDEEWIEKTAQIVFSQAKEKGEMKGHDIPEAFVTYGHNVPEYYFLNYEIDETFVKNRFA